MQVFCFAEDRPSCEPSLRLLVSSFCRHCGNRPVQLSFPPASKQFRDWVAQFPSINLSTDPIPGAYGWNVKPQAILSMLDKGHRDVVWIDSDIIIARDCAQLFSNLGHDDLVVTEEALYGYYSDADGLRARGWGFRVGRRLPFTLNSGVIRATAAHRDLLCRWKDLLSSDQYKTAQRLPWYERPVHLYGDQDVLTALLASVEYSQVPVKILRRGRDIIQFFGPYGYTVRERLGHIARGLPTFIHSQVGKPWIRGPIAPAQGLRQKFDSLYLDLSPYTLAATQYREHLTDVAWLDPRSSAGRILRRISMEHPAVAGLPLAVVADAYRMIK